MFWCENIVFKVKQPFPKRNKYFSRMRVLAQKSSWFSRKNEELNGINMGGIIKGALGGRVEWPHRGSRNVRSPHNGRQQGDCDPMS